jgi:small subunit ribosomal protein S2
MKAITLEELLEAGCHFGHQVTRQNPKAREFVFEARDNIHIIDLGKTKEGLEESAQFLLNEAKKENSTLLIVGTKRQAEPIVVEEVKRVTEDGKKDVGLFTVTKRWMGGTLTNTLAISRNYARLKEIKENLHTDEWKAKYTKKELMLFEREMQKLEAYYGGISSMKAMPTALFVIDTHTEDLAVREGRRMNVPVVGIVDTNADPDLVDYVIPANDDAVGSLKLLIGYILDAWVEGKTAGEKEKSAAVEKATKEAARSASSGQATAATSKEEVKKETSPEKEAKPTEKVEKKVTKKSEVKA